MSQEITFEFRGPEGVKQRIREIRSRMGLDRNEFAATLDKELKPTPMAGSIGTVKPFDPTEGGFDTAILRRHAEAAAKEYGIDPRLFDALIEAESGYQTNAVSSKGAVGLGQLMSGTAAEMGVTDRTDPLQNLRASAKYFSQQLRNFNGDPSLALAAYNAGPNRIKQLGRVPDNGETREYVDRILRKYNAKVGR